MIYFCFVESTTTPVPHMEPIDVETPDQARLEAQRLLARHTSAQRVRIFLEDQELDTLRRAGLAPQSIVPENRLLATTGLTPKSERRYLRAGEALADDTDLIWFPLDVVIRIEAGDRGLLAGWEDRHGAVGLVPLSKPGSMRWIAQTDGYAVAVDRNEIGERLRVEPNFNAAVLRWLAQSREEAFTLAANNLQDSAQDRVVRLFRELSAREPAGPISICQNEIGRLLGMQRTTVCGVMTKLKAAKVIKHMRGRVTSFEPDRLMAS